LGIQHDPPFLFPAVPSKDRTPKTKWHTKPVYFMVNQKVDRAGDDQHSQVIYFKTLGKKLFHAVLQVRIHYGSRSIYLPLNKNGEH
jgi:hypothetical protein